MAAAVRFFGPKLSAFVFSSALAFVLSGVAAAQGEESRLFGDVLQGKWLGVHFVRSVPLWPR